MLEKLGFKNVRYFDHHHTLSPLGKRILKSARRAALEGIADHKAAGNPIYYKEQGILIKELPDETRYHVKATRDGIETIRKL